MTIYWKTNTTRMDKKGTKHVSCLIEMLPWRLTWHQPHQLSPISHSGIYIVFTPKKKKKNMRVGGFCIYQEGFIDLFRNLTRNSPPTTQLCSTRGRPPVTQFCSPGRRMGSYRTQSLCSFILRSLSSDAPAC